MKHTVVMIAFLGGLAAISALFVYWASFYLAAEHTIYSWDFEFLWLLSWQLAVSFTHGLWSGLAALGLSLHHEYNDTSALPSAIAMAFFGPSRFSYVMSIVTLIVLPAGLTCVLLFVRSIQPNGTAIAFRLLAFFAVLCVPAPWVVTFLGMTDVAGLLAVFVAVDLMVRTDPNSRDACRWLFIGAAMAIAALLKRWYLFWALGMLAVMGVESALRLVRGGRLQPLSLAACRTALMPLFLVTCSLGAVLMLSFPRPLVVLTTNYSQVYSAYQMASGPAEALALNMAEVAGYYGIASVVLSFAAFTALIWMPPTRRSAIYFFVPSWLALIDFSRVQTMTVQHPLLMFISIVVPPLFLAQHLLSSGMKGARSLAWTVLIVMGLLNALGFWSVFATSPPLGDSFAQKALPTVRERPSQRHDFAQIEALLNFVSSTVAAPGLPPTEDVYVLSDSSLFNCTILSTYQFQMQKIMPGCDHICRTSDVDLRDGFPYALLTAKLVLVADPLQTQLPHVQRVLNVPAEDFLRGGGFSLAFRREPVVYQLDDGVKVYVFSRTRPSAPEEIAALRAAVGVPLVNARWSILHARALFPWP